MKRKEIEVGSEYAVYIGYSGSRVFRPYEERGHQKTMVNAEHFHFTEGVPYGRHNTADQDAVRATVEATDAVRWTRTSRWYNNYSQSKDGILVKLHKPLVVQPAYSDKKETVTHVVVKPQHLLRPWAEHARQRNSEREMEKRHAREKQEAYDAAQRDYAALGARLVALGFTRGGTWEGGDFDYTLYDDKSFSKFEITFAAQLKLIEQVERLRQLVRDHWSPEQAETLLLETTIFETTNDKDEEAA